MTRYIASMGSLANKTAIDIPAGDGRATYNLIQGGAKVIPMDLFPEFLKVPNVVCQSADLQERFPAESGQADIVVSQEGIEHVSNQHHVFTEFNRVLKTGGLLLLTTPNLSNMRSRLAMFLIESDFWKRMPPSEMDSIWFSSKESKKLYFGHLFLLNIQKVRALAAITGFRIKEVVQTDISPSSLGLTLILYPLLVLVNFLSCLLYLRKNPHVSRRDKMRIFREQIGLNLNFKILAGKHIFVVFEKICDAEENIEALKSMTLPHASS